MLGFPVGEPQAAATLAESTLPSRRLELPTSLSALDDSTPFQRALHTHGRGYLDLIRGFSGAFEMAPDIVAFPTTGQEVVDLMDWASANKVAVLPFGGGTSVVGGVTLPTERWQAHRGVLSLDLTKMDRVLEVDADSLSARVQGGATGPLFNAQLADSGMVLRHYPQSYEFATLGGMIATRSGGHFATVYTHIDELVQGLRTETPAGPVESWRLPGSGAGPSPDRIMMGSEGAFGIITEAWMRVRRLPVWRANATLFFDDFKSAVLAARDLAQSQLGPSNCRVLGPNEAALHRVSKRRGQSVLLVGFESAAHPVAPLLALALDLIAARGGTLSGPPEYRQTPPKGAKSESKGANEGAASSWKAAFIDMPYLQSNLMRLGVLADTFETACTWERFEALHTDLIKNVRAAMKSSTPHGVGFLSCRFTHVYPDGPAPYYTFITPARRGDEAAQWADIKAAASETLAKHRATITHHHAVGRRHLPWATPQRPQLFGSALSAVKDTFDPGGVLNPGVLGLG